VRIQGRPADMKMSDHPGPGSYEYSHGQTKDKTVNVLFGSSKRDNGGGVFGKSQDLPGPGNYDGDVKQMGKSGPKFTFSAKPNRKETTLSPGPGAYEGEVSATRARNPNIKIGSSSRGDMFGKSHDDSALIGPG